MINYLSLAIHTEEIFENSDLRIMSPYEHSNHGMSLNDLDNKIAHKFLQLLFGRLKFDLFLQVKENVENFDSVMVKMIEMLLISVKKTHVSDPRLATYVNMIA